MTRSRTVHSCKLQCFSNTKSAGKDHPGPFRLTNSAFPYLRVLVVDDQPLNLRVFGMMLKKFGCKTTLAENGQRALSACEQQSFDLILMDIELPDMPGYRVASEILMRKKEHQEVPIIAISGYKRSSILDQCLAAGMRDCLEKPIGLGVLKKLLEQISTTSFVTGIHNEISTANRTSSELTPRTFSKPRLV